MLCTKKQKKKRKKREKIFGGSIKNKVFITVKDFIFPKIILKHFVVEHKMNEFKFKLNIRITAYLNKLFKS